MLTGLISVPLTLTYLGQERFGLWAAISSATTMLQFTDLGMGNGLINALTQAHGREDRDAARRAVSSAFFFLLAIAIAVLIAFLAAYPFVPWARLYNVTSAEGIHDAGPATLALICCWILSMPLGIAQRVQVGFQEGYRRNIWQMAGSVLTLACILVMTRVRARLPWLVLSLTAVSALTAGLNWIAEFVVARPYLTPHVRYFDFATGWRLVKSGLLFCALTIASIVGTNTDPIVIAHMLGASAVTDYSIVAKMFTISMLSSILFQPLWPAFGEAIQRGDLDWVRRTTDRSLLAAGGIAAATGMILMLLGPGIVLFWLSRQASPGSLLFCGFAAWGIVAALNDVLVSILSTSQFLKRFVIMSAVAAVAVFGLKVLFTPLLQNAGTVWGTAIGYAAFFTVPAIVLVRKSLLKQGRLQTAAG